MSCSDRTCDRRRNLRGPHATESGLNVVESYNGGNDYIRFGKSHAERRLDLSGPPSPPEALSAHLRRTAELTYSTIVSGPG